MTYWVYDPKKLVSPTSLIPYRQSKPGEIFNFLTIFIILMSGYLHKTGQLNKHGNSIFLLLVTTFIFGVTTGLVKEEKQKSEIVFGKYDDTLVIE